MVNRESVQETLSRMARNPIFSRTTHSIPILRYLADKYFKRKNTELKEYTIGVDVLGKPKDYDPNNDTSVRVEMNRLRSRLKKYYLNSLEEIHFEIPRGRYDLIITDTPVVREHRNHHWLRTELTEKEKVTLLVNMGNLDGVQCECIEYFVHHLTDKLSFYRNLDISVISSISSSYIRDNSSQGDNLGYLIHINIFHPQELVTMFLTLVERESEDILYSKRMALNNGNGEDFDKHTEKIAKEIFELVQPYSVKKVNKLLCMNSENCTLNQALILFRFHEFHYDRESLEKCMDILRRLLKKNPNHPLIIGILMQAMLLDDAYWCNPHGDIQSITERFNSLSHESFDNNPYMLDCLIFHYYVKEDKKSILQLVELLKRVEDPTGVITAHGAYAIYTMGFEEIALTMVKKHDNKQIYPYRWYHILRGLDCFSKGDLIGFKKHISNLKNSIMPRDLLLYYISCHCDSNEGPVFSDFQINTLLKILKGMSPVSYLNKLILKPEVKKKFIHILEQYPLV